MNTVRKLLKIDYIEEKGIFGQDIVVAILDTGMAEHPDLKGKIILFKDFIGDREKCYDDNGHGTHVAGIIAGESKDRLYGRMNRNGIAKRSQLVVLKVLNAKGIGIEDKVIDGIKWIIDNYEKYNIKIVNISFGTIHNNCSEMRLIKYVEILWQLGLVVVAAAGNNGPDIGSITVPGVSKKIITVGVVEDGKKVNVNGRYTSNYSGRGPTCECIQKPDLIAYGNNIVSCNNNYKLKKYTVKSGTSMATPVVTGCAALLLSKYPELKNIDVKRKMIESCKDVNLPANIQGAGVINPVELLGVK